ncbi:methyl-accepting chemotaxis protein [Pleurocapsa sp. PCC 7327]|uniref:GAF domain-containing protein n=1 Tax=Pleurocapsa sp. PCC 7327 TaxID=118163 RepID=UPI00029FBAC3|nr:GAF domain-containing protein [Pleurocapsa sp. PCC 7327]AFY76363.1 methyl-accepting chemotaxis protein [Pleurocapsa sp. PCC 7327]
MTATHQPTQFSEPDRNFDNPLASNGAQIDAQTSLAAVAAVKSVLEESGYLEKPELKERIAQIEQLAYFFQENLQKKSSAAREWFKPERTLLAEIIDRIRRVRDLNELLDLIVASMREKIEADRVFVYRFSSDERGNVLAESKVAGWTPCLGEDLPAIAFGLERRGDYLTRQASAIDAASFQLTPYQRQLLERFQIKSSLSLPILVEGEVWGLLTVQQCSAGRDWQAAEIDLLHQICLELTTSLQREAFSARLQERVQENQLLAKVLEKIGKVEQSDDLNAILKTATQETRLLLKTDRVAVYRFAPDWSGEFIAESVASGWVPLVGTNPRWEDTYLQDTQGGRFRGNEIYVLDDIYKAGLSACHLDLLEQYQAKSHAIAPIFQGKNLWGLLAVYQNSAPRNWQETEIGFLKQIATQISTALQQVETFEQLQTQTNQLAKLLEQEQAVSRVIARIRQSLDLDTVFNTTAREARLLLEADRVAVYRFNPDWSGDFVAESVASGWMPIIGSQATQNLLRWADPYFQETQGGRFRNNEPFILNDIHNTELTPCHIEALEQYEAQSCIIVSIFQGQKLWGLLAAYQNDKPRQWQMSEVNFLEKIAARFGTALQQAEILQQVQAKSDRLAQLVEQEQAVAKVIARIRQSLDLDTIFNTTTKEVRSLLNVDRVAVYRFNPDWSGEFIAESVTSGWSKLVERQNRISGLQESITDCASIQSLIASSGNEQTSRTRWTDTYLQDNQGGRLQNKEAYVREDIYQAGFPACYLETLERYDIKAYAIVPVFLGQKLWGMLAAFQNSGTRPWQETEIKFLKQIAAQFSVALQQAGYVNTIEEQSKQLAQAAEREKNFVRFLVKINQRIIEQSQQKLALESLLKTSAQELRKLLKVDRVAISRFTPDWNREFIAEDISAGCVRLAGTEAALVENPDLQDSQGGRYRDRQNLVIDNIDSAELASFESEWFEQLGIKACAIAPIFEGEQLWGLLEIYQNNHTRQWQESEVDLLAQASVQLGVAIQQADYLERVQAQSQQLATSIEREKALKEQLQQRASQLLVSVLPALTGDLTVRAPITDDEIGTIADAYNETLQSLRKIVVQVQAVAKKLAQTAQGNTAVVQECAVRMGKQFQDLKGALDQIQQMVNLTRTAAGKAKQVEAAVREANQILQKGDTTMNLTVGSILTIRETVSETAQRIKRLSESSQKISKVVQLIGNFATQTNLLAMNAALEATRAGENGRGFAVVAEEVRSLSHQSAAATTEIEELVAQMQSETEEVAKAMETGIDRVLEGTGLVDEVRESLNEIVAATAQIGKQVEDILQVAHKQHAQAGAVTGAIKNIWAIANHNAEKSRQIAEAFQVLLALSQDLQKSTGQFKVG